MKKDDVVFAEDTGIKVTLIYFVDSEMGHITIGSFEKKKGANKSGDIDIKLSASVLDKHIAQYLLVIHPFSGCDTTHQLHTIR